MEREELTWYAPAVEHPQFNRMLVVICPGGGYRFLSPRESEPVALAFAQMGCHACVVRYDTGTPGLGVRPLRQLAAAVRQAADEAEWRGFDPQKIFLCGFSAGGHLAASLGVYWYDPAVTALELGRAVRPRGMILGYPVVTMGEYAHPGSRMMLTGGNPGLINIFSLEMHVKHVTPPVFLWQTATDEKVPVQNSLMLVEACLEAGVPCEYHLYPTGLHGMSLATEEVASPEENLYPDPHIAGWLQQCQEWLLQYGADD